MSASNGRPPEATGRRSGAAAPARRTMRNHRFVGRSNSLKTRLPWNSLTGVAAPGVATVCALAAAGSARAAAAARAMAMRRICRFQLAASAEVTPRSLVARDREADEQRDVDRVDDERERQHDEDAAARAVVEEDELEHAGDDGVGDEGPLGDAKEGVPVEAVDAAQRHEVRRHHEGRGGEEED